MTCCTEGPAGQPGRRRGGSARYCTYWSSTKFRYWYSNSDKSLARVLSVSCGVSVWLIMLTSWGRCILGVSRPSILFNATCFAPFRYLSTVQCRPYLHLPHHYIPCWISAFHCSPTVQAGHNKWSKIKHKKTAADSERSKVISKHSSRIVAAVRAGGSANADLNDRLMSVISDARDAGLSKSNIENALRSGNSSSRSQAAEPVLYEGRGPSGYSILIEAVTDNRNRTRPEIRTMLEKHG